MKSTNENFLTGVIVGFAVFLICLFIFFIASPDMKRDAFRAGIEYTIDDACSECKCYSVIRTLIARLQNSV